MRMPEVGDQAPEFETLDDSGQAVRVSDLRGRRVVLYFYPRADTPGCTKEACSFRDDFSAYESKNVVILGVSPDTERAQAKFRAKYKLPFHLLADPDHAISEMYGTWGLKKFMGREFMGVRRTTFVIDERGDISHVFEGVQPAEHSAEVLAGLT